MRAKLYSSQEGQRIVTVNTAPLWGPNGEVPIAVREFHDGGLRWYGTGTAVADLRELPITVRMPYLVVRGVITWAVPVKQREELTMALKKITAASGGPATTGNGPADATAWPTLLEYLTTTKYPDGSPRETSCVVITADASGWRGCVSDKDNQRTLWKVSETVEGLLLALEAALMADDPSDWRQSSAAKWKGKKRG